MSISLSVIHNAAYAIQSQIPAKAPEVLLILGSGLGVLAEQVEDAQKIPYDDIPGFPVSTAPGHKGLLVAGQLAGRQVLIMQGRFHHYEGVELSQLVLPVYVARILGASTLMVTNACGAVNPDFQPGDIVCLDDHIKFFGESPLRGPNTPQLGTRFPDMTYAYTPALRRLADTVAEELSIPLRHGVYQYFPGPQYETPAEIRAARVLGADVVGMSTVPEVIAARHAGLDVLGLSLVCNMAAGILDQPLTEEEVLHTADAAKAPFSKLVVGLLRALPQNNAPD